MLDLALAAASRIVRERIEAGDPVAARALREALDALPRATPVKVRLHADDAAAIESALAAEIAAGRITIEPDRGVERGGCLVESSTGIIDATLEVAEAAVRAAAEGRAETP